MVQQLTPETVTPITYPDSDGQPMADNTKQFRWIVRIKENLEILFATVPDIFIAGDLLWYPVEGNSKIRQAPDVMAVNGRPKGDRSSYKQWEEDNIPPQVVFEILSPGNTSTEMTKKLLFYQRYGVEEYYVYDPDSVELTGSMRSHDRLEEIDNMNGWVSPLLGIRFELTPDTLEIYGPGDRRFLTSVELDQFREQESQRADRQQQEKQLAQQQLEEERTLRQQEQQRYQALIELLREKGIDPQQL